MMRQRKVSRQLEEEPKEERGGEPLSGNRCTHGHRGLGLDDEATLLFAFSV